MEVAQLEQVRIVLVEPSGPRNVGAIARVMKNMGLSRLILVNPQCDRLCDEARQMAVHAQDLLENAEQVKALPDALQGCYRAIATTARKRDLNLEPESPREALPWLLEVPSALIFGREDSGLTNTELNYAQRYVAIAANPDYSSLNLAQAVGICAYELRSAALSLKDSLKDEHNDDSRLQRERGLRPSEIRSTESLASLDVLEGYFQHLETCLLDIGYLQPHTASSRMTKFRQLYKRAALSDNEVALLRGILSRMEWILQNR